MVSFSFGRDIWHNVTPEDDGGDGDGDGGGDGGSEF